MPPIARLLSEPFLTLPHLSSGIQEQHFHGCPGPWLPFMFSQCQALTHNWRQEEKRSRSISFLPSSCLVALLPTDSPCWVSIPSFHCVDVAPGLRLVSEGWEQLPAFAMSSVVLWLFNFSVTRVNDCFYYSSLWLEVIHFQTQVTVVKGCRWRHGRVLQCATAVLHLTTVL